MATNGPLSYSKAADLAGDAARGLQPHLDAVTRSTALQGQHAIRAWEYAMALYTIEGWERQQTPLEHDRYRAAPLRIVDVGGAGSQFWRLLRAQTAEPVVLIDPAIVSAQQADYGDCFVYGRGLEDFVTDGAHAGSWDVLTCISVIEHIEEVRRFFRAAAALLKPGGLLFLTTDYWDRDGRDDAHFHWMRQRIYNAETIKKRVVEPLREIGFKSFGTADWGYAGNQVYDYSVVSVAMVRR